MRVAVSRCQRFWLQIFSEVKNQGIVDVMIAVCDGLKKGLPEAIQYHLGTHGRAVHRSTWFRNSFRYTGRQHHDTIVKSLTPVHTAPSEQAAKDQFAVEWGNRYPAIVQL